MRRGLFYTDDESAVLPGALPALTDVRERGLAHQYVRHIRSSQAFALSLFAPLEAVGVSRVLAQLGHTVEHTEKPIFEYEDDHDRLQEASRRSPHRTQVDVLLRGATARGQRIAALIEVKFTEQDFGSCSAFANPENPDRTACEHAGLFGGDPAGCFQLQNHGFGHRRYAEYLAPVTITAPLPRADDGGCLVRLGRSQPMRNLALAHVLAAEGDFDHVVFAVCAPEQHTAIWRRYEEFRTAFSDTDRVTIRPLRAEFVARQHPDQGTALAGKYGATLGNRSGADLHRSLAAI